MTYCPKCGTANRDGSQFCNQCGELLGTEGRKCPNCGTLNPGQNPLCTECGARLEPPAGDVSGPGELSLSAGAGSETESDEGHLASTESEEELPGWLRDLGATEVPEGQALPDPLDEPAEIPAWLRDLRASIPAASREGMEQTAEREESWEPSAEPPPGPEHRPAAPSPAEMRETEVRPTEPVEPAGPLPEDEGEPDWLADLKSASGEEEPSAAPGLPELEDEKVPDWLARLQPSEEDVLRERNRHAPDTPSTSEEAGADWLDMDSPSEMEQEPRSELPAFGTGDEDSLDWLAELIPPPLETGARATDSAPLPGEGEAPDWLKELDSSPQEPKQQSEPEPSQTEAETIPDWLARPQDLETEEGFARETAVSEAEPSADWLEEAQAPEAGVAPEAEPEWGEAEPGLEVEEEARSDRPDTLAGLAAVMAADLSGPSQEEGTEEVPDQPFPPSTIEAEVAPEFAEEGEVDEEVPTSDEELSDAEIPEWLAALQPEGIEETLPELEEAAVELESVDLILPSEPATKEGELEMADIPAWLLALKPTELREEGEHAELPLGLEGIDTDTGLLSGLQGTLPVEMIIAQPRADTAARTVEPSIVETVHTRLFHDIVGRVPEAVPRQIAQAPVRKPMTLPRWLLYLALIVVVSFPLLLREPLLIRTIEPAQATTDLYNAIETLDSNAAVLVAFDYDPTTSGEMEVIGQALVGHIMDRGAKVIAMSLLPAGPATAQPLLDDLAAERPEYDDSYGQRYVNLGYLPGQAAAVRLAGLSTERAFASDFQGTPLAELPVMQGVTNAQDFDLILELAAKQDSVRWWIEQASMPYGVQLAAGVSAPVAPLAQPYYETDPRQLVGVIGGVAGAVTYEALQSEQGSLAQSTVSRLDSQMAGQLLLILVLLVGNGIFLVQRGARRER